MSYEEANSDSTNVTEAPNNRHMQYTYLGAIAMECTQLCSIFNNIIYSHVKTAYFLVKFAIFFFNGKILYMNKGIKFQVLHQKEKIKTPKNPYRKTISALKMSSPQTITPQRTKTATSDQLGTR